MDLPAPFDVDLKVLVMAGSDRAPEGRPRAIGRGEPLSGKAFLRLHGRLVIEYVLDLLRVCGLRRVWVLAAEDELALVPRGYAFTPIQQSPVAHFGASLATASRALNPATDEAILVVFGDHPLQAPNALRAFLATAGGVVQQADLIHAIASTEAYGAYAPWFTRTSVHMREMSGRASGFSLVVPTRLHGLAVLGELYEVRKLERFDSLLRLMFKFPGLLGRDAPRALVDAVLVVLAKEMERLGRGSSLVATPARFLESWFSARVPAERLERYAARVLGAERGVRLIPVAHGGIAIDLDFPEELAMLEAHWDTVQELSARQDAALRLSWRSATSPERPSSINPADGAPASRSSPASRF